PHLWRAYFSGTGDQAGDGRGGIFRRRGRSAASRDGDLGQEWRSGGVSRQADQRYASARPLRGIRQESFRADEGFRRVRFSRVARRQLRAAGVFFSVVEIALPRRFLLLVVEQPADGLLFAVATGAGRAAPWHRRASHYRAMQPLGSHTGAGRQWLRHSSGPASGKRFW